jgi:hypothetical protein
MLEQDSTTQWFLNSATQAKLSLKRECIVKVQQRSFPILVPGLWSGPRLSALPWRWECRGLAHYSDGPTSLYDGSFSQFRHSILMAVMGQNPQSSCEAAASLRPLALNKDFVLCQKKPGLDYHGTKKLLHLILTAISSWRSPQYTKIQESLPLEDARSVYSISTSRH